MPVTPEDFADRVAPHRDAVLRYATRLVGLPDAGGLLQSALAQAWRERDEVARADGSLAWLLGIVRRLAGPRRAAPAADLLVGTDPADRELEQMLCRLPRLQRDVVDLEVFAEADPVTTSRVLVLPFVTVDRARAGAADALAAAGVEPDRLDAYADRWREGLAEASTQRGTARARAGLRRRVGLGAAVLALGAAVVVVGLVEDSADLTPNEPTSGEAPAAGQEDPQTSQHPRCQDELTTGPVEITRIRASTQLRVPLVLIDDSPCTMRGFAEVVPLAGARRIDVELVHRPADAELRGIPAVVVYPGTPAIVTIAWDPGRFCPALDNDQLLITPPGATHPVVAPGFGDTACGDDGARPAMEVYPVRPGRPGFPANQLIRAGGAG